MGFGIGSVFEFNHHQGQPVDKEDDVGAAVVVVFDDGELIHREEFVIFGGFPVNQPELFAVGFSIALIFNGNAFGEVAMKDFVVVNQVRAGDVLQFALGLVANVGGNVGIDSRQGLGQAVFEQHITKALAFGGGSFGFEGVAVFVGVVQGIEQFEVVFFDLVFRGKFTHKTGGGVGVYSLMRSLPLISFGRSTSRVLVKV